MTDLLNLYMELVIVSKVLNQSTKGNERFHIFSERILHNDNNYNSILHNIIIIITKPIPASSYMIRLESLKNLF